jgi:anaerobic magnesium-protoporphyrin IX monomethyl ester cyclase
VTSVLLVYPFIRRSLDRSRFRFPPLGPAYVAASLRRAGHEVRLLDCTFLSREQARRSALAARADVVGVYCMATMREDAVWFARQLRGSSDLLVAGGPLPTCEPEAFLADFDVVVRGEGEQTMVDLLAARAAGADVGAVPGTVVSAADGGAAAAGPPRPFATDLDALPFPARDLLPNAAYISHGRRRYGYAVTTVMSSRGCPFACEFCSNVVFGSLYRKRSPASVVDEIEEALAPGYDRIAFSDDVFTLRPERVAAVCDEIERRGLVFDWECLARVDGVDRETAARMRRAGCRTVFFGIESGSDEVLRLMRKGITAAQARDAVWAAHDAGLEVGAFFILCYPGDTDETVLETLRFAGSLPLDYLGLSMPYPLPGTRLRERMEGRATGESRPDGSLLLNQQLTYRGDFSAAKMRFAILAGRGQFELRRRLGHFGPAAARLTEAPAEALFRRLR